MPSKKLSKQNKKNASKNSPTKRKRPPRKKAKPVEESISIAEQVIDAGLILEACGNDEEVAQFYLVWLQNGRNATKAYLALHPEVKQNSACILGGRLLGKVNKTEIARAYGISYETYFKQLKEGMNAKKQIRFFGKVIDEQPDHKIRRAYHEAVGEMLGMETKNQNNTAVQVNVNKVVDDWIVKE
jgi:hypothetical protein